MANREPISKKLRFEVFKRDNFTCQYCGQKAPDVILHIDHINPVSKGGGSDILNLITACSSCNGGKSDRLLTDQAEIEKQRAQLEELSERRDQLEAMIQWRNELETFEFDKLAVVATEWERRTPGYNLNENGDRSLKKWDARFGTELLLDAIKAAADQYLVFEDGKPTEASVEMAFSMVPRVAGGMKTQAEKPYMRDVYYVRAVLRNRLPYLNERQFIQVTEDAVRAGVDLVSLRDYSKRVRSWTEYREGLEGFIASAKPEDDDK